MVGFFSRAGYSIVDAKIHTTSDGYALDTFVLLDVSDRDSEREMISYIEHELANACLGTQPARHRQRAHLASGETFPAAATGQHPAAGQPRSRRNRKDVRADRRRSRSPGLLFIIATQLAAHRANLHTAKIATLGERVEDTFLISGGHLEESACRVKLETDLLKQLQTLTMRLFLADSRPAAAWPARAAVITGASCPAWRMLCRTTLFAFPQELTVSIHVALNHVTHYRYDRRSAVARRSSACGRHRIRARRS
jgi:hypothetical protein